MAENVTRVCKRHGETVFSFRTERITKTGKEFNRYRCRKCTSEAVARRRRKVKQILVDERGGKCERCGYNKSIKALDFHHRNKSEKEFAISAKGITISIEKIRLEANKCDLICANCHREIEEEEFNDMSSKGKKSGC